MLEVKVTRKCNICGKIMANENYWSCERAYAESNEYVKQQAIWTGSITYDGTAQLLAKTDVCQGCWEKMMAKGHP